MHLPELVSVGLAGFLAWLFAVSSFHKLAHPAQFGQLAGQYLPSALRGLGRGVLAFPVGAVEALVALALLLPQWRVAGAAGAAALLVGYALLMAWQLALGRRDLRCGCAGPASDVVVSPALVMRNLVVACLALLLTLPVSPMALSMPGLALALGMVGLLVGVYLSAEQLLSNSQFMARSR